MCLDDMGSIWVIKILQAHLLRAFVANLKTDAIYALYTESFCDKNVAARKVFAFSDSDPPRPPIGMKVGFSQPSVSSVVVRKILQRKKQWLEVEIVITT